MDEYSALKIYGRASLFEDNELASTMLSRAARVPLHQISRDTVKDLSTSALELLMSAKEMYDHKEIELTAIFSLTSADKSAKKGDCRLVV